MKKETSHSGKKRFRIGLIPARRQHLVPGQSQNRYHHEHRQAIVQSRIFDNRFYLEQVYKAGITDSIHDPLEHYLTKGDALRISPNAIFDCFFYHDVNRDVEPAGMTALYHFIKHGMKEGRNPHPFFDTKYVAQQIADERDPLRSYLDSPPGILRPHPLFDEEYVVLQLLDTGRTCKNALIDFIEAKDYQINPNRDFDMSEYSRINSDIKTMNPFYHYIVAGKREGRRAVPVNMSVRPLISQIMKAADLDCDILTPGTNLYEIDRIRSFGADSEKSELMSRLISVCGIGRNNIFIFVPCLVAGGAEKVLSYFLRAITEVSDKKVVVCITDSGNSTTIDWMPRSENIMVFDLYSTSRNMRKTDLLQCLGIYFQMARPNDVIVMNSKVGWDLLETFGRPLSSVVQLHCFAFCYDYGQDGRRMGYAWTHLPRAFQNLTTIISDNTKTIKQFSRDLNLGESDEKLFYVLKQPAPRTLALNLIKVPENQLDKKTKRKTVLWAGRFHAQKNLGLALQLAQQMQETDFIFAGGSQNEAEIIYEMLSLTPNMSFYGHYTDFSKLPLSKCDAFIHTSDWDGLPNVILEAAGANLPIVARDVGGVSDLITNETGWLLPEISSPNEYKVALNEIFSNSDLVGQRMANLETKLESLHSWQAYVDSAKSLLGRFENAKN